MRKILFILTVAMIIMAVIIIPVGISNIVLALQLGLLFESVSSLFFLCLFIAFCLFEIREFIEEYSWYYEEIQSKECTICRTMTCRSKEVCVCDYT